MHIEIDIDQVSGVAVANCSGKFGADDAMKGAAMLWQNPDWPGKASVWNFRDAIFEMTSDEIESVAQFVRGNQPETPQLRVAFVAPRDVNFGLARIFEVYREDPLTDFRVFRSFEDALVWAKGID